MPISRQARITRTAISPRLAMRSVRNTAARVSLVVLRGAPCQVGLEPDDSGHKTERSVLATWFLHWSGRSAAGESEPPSTALNQRNVQSTSHGTVTRLQNRCSDRV